MAGILEQRHKWRAGWGGARLAEIEVGILPQMVGI
jgi:hypothetical protein